MCWPRDLPPIQWPEPLLSVNGYPMRISQETRDIAYASGNAEFRRMQVRVALVTLAAVVVVTVLLARRQRR
jgi:hypothetical protein